MESVDVICIFCNKNGTEVKYIIGAKGKYKFICNECIDVCNEIIDSQEKQREVKNKAD